MSRTEIRSHQVKDGSIQNVDIDINTPGKSLITKIVAGDGIQILSTGADDGTGVVTVSASKSSNNIKQVTYSQQVSVQEWNIVHNLGLYPEVTVIDESGSKVFCDIYYESLNNVKLIFETSFSGIAALTANESEQGNFIQSTASSTWDVVHNLNRYPDIIIFDTSMDNLRIYGDITYISLNELKVDFGSPVAGELYYI